MKRFLAEHIFVSLLRVLYSALNTILDRPTIDNFKMSDEATSVRPHSENPATEVQVPAKNGLEATLAAIRVAVTDQRLIDNILYVRRVCEERTLFKACTSDSQNIDTILSVWCPLQALAKCCETQMPNTWLAPWILRHIKQDLSDSLKAEGHSPAISVAIQILLDFMEGTSDEMWKRVKAAHDGDKRNITTFVDVNLTVLTVLEAIRTTLDETQRTALKESVQKIYGEDKHISFPKRPTELEKFVERAHMLCPFYNWNEFFKASYEYFWRMAIDKQPGWNGIVRPGLMSNEHVGIFLSALYPVLDVTEHRLRKEKNGQKMKEKIANVKTVLDAVVGGTEWIGEVKDQIETAKRSLDQFVSEGSKNGSDDSNCCIQ